MTTHLKVKCAMRNNPWKKHQKVFETIKITKKLICPSGHRQNLLLKCEEGNYSYDGMCWQAKKFLNDIYLHSRDLCLIKLFNFLFLFFNLFNFFLNYN